VSDKLCGGGAMLGVALGASWTDAKVTSPKAMYTAIIVLIVLCVLGTGYVIYDGVTTDRRIRTLSAAIRKEIDFASGIEYRAFQAGEAGKLNRDALIQEIERWRDKVDAWLRQELPESGADIRFRTGSGQLGLPPMTAPAYTSR
jgi:hypothetical protein